MINTKRFFLQVTIRYWLLRYIFNILFLLSIRETNFASRFKLFFLKKNLMLLVYII